MFNLYFAGTDPHADDLLQERNALRLFSQANEKNRIANWEAAGFGGNLFIDSGAFSVAYSGKHVDIDDYVSYINAHTNIPIFVELDEIPMPLTHENVIKCADVSWNNYLYMIERVRPDATILPLFHYGEPYQCLERILNTPVNGKLVDYIGIPGRHGVSKTKQIQHFNKVFTLIQNSKNPNVKVHAFGVTMLPVLEQFPFYSADSTSWLMTAITGSIMTECCGVVYMDNNVTGIAENEIISRGFTKNELITDYTKRMRYNVITMLNWANNYQYKGKKCFNNNMLF